MTPEQKLVEDVARAIFPTFIYGRDEEDVPFEQIMTRPRHVGMKNELHRCARAALAVALEAAANRLRNAKDHEILMPAPPRLCDLVRDNAAEIVLSLLPKD